MNAVVQVFVQGYLFNWLEPYKSPDQIQIIGSGFFINAQGYLVSSFHVVNNAITVQIQIPTLGKERFDVVIVGSCPERDVSLLKLTDEALEQVEKKLGVIEFLNFGDSDKVLRNQEIIALGYPLGQESLKSTQGIVSGRQDILGESFLQITAALNPGNSGGPSLDAQGNVIGINAAIIQEAQNIGYIVPISDVKNVMSDLFKVKLLRRAVLGCELNYGTLDMLHFLKNPEPGGLYVAEVYPNTLFDKAGIKRGDMLYQIAGYDLDMYGDATVTWSEDKVSLTALINRFSLGQKIGLIIYRKGVKKELSLSFDLLDPLPIRVKYPEYETIDYEIVGGMVIMEFTLNHFDVLLDLNPFIINFRNGATHFEPCLVITTLFPSSQTYQARVFSPGDFLVEVNEKPVKTLADFRKIVEYDKDTFIRFKTESKKFMVLALEKILHEEDRLSIEWGYTKSSLVQKLQSKLQLT